MPFSIKIHLGAEHPIIFEGWINEAIGKCLLKGTAFATAHGPDGSGVIVTNGPMFLSPKPELLSGMKLEPGDNIAFGSADGEEIPYGKPECIFVRTADN